MTETVQIELTEDQRVLAIQWMLDYAAAIAPTGVGVTPIATVIEGAEALARYVAGGEQPVRPAEGE